MGAWVLASVFLTGALLVETYEVTDNPGEVGYSKPKSYSSFHQEIDQPSTTDFGSSNAFLGANQDLHSAAPISINPLFSNIHLLPTKLLDDNVNSHFTDKLTYDFAANTNSPPFSEDRIQNVGDYTRRSTIYGDQNTADSVDGLSYANKVSFTKPDRVYEDDYSDEQYVAEGKYDLYKPKKKEVHYHQHKHLHEHEHKQEHVHKHKQEHIHQHDHGHSHNAHHSHSHAGKHEHDHKSEHKHGHSDHHQHEHQGKHSHSHKQEHKHGHDHSHKHDHYGDHKHEHKHSGDHTHDHHGKHEHGHHHDHKHEGFHKHEHHGDHKHSHGHQHESSHKHNHHDAHEHKHKHKVSVVSKHHH